MASSTIDEAVAAIASTGATELGQVPTRFAIRRLARRYPVSSLFVLAFALTWAIEIPLVAGARHLIALEPSSPLGGIMQLFDGWMPGLAAIVITGLAAGRTGIKTLLRRIVAWRVGIGWYLVAFFGVLVLWIPALALDRLIGGSGLKLPALTAALVAGGIGAFLQFFLFNSEDLAWRGFVITRLQSRHRAVIASLILAPFWAVFHLPFFFLPHGLQASMGFPAFLIQLTGLSILFTWLFNSTRGSVLLCMILHASQNTWTVVFAPSTSDATTSSWMYTAFVVITAVVVVFAFGAARLSRPPASSLSTDRWGGQ
jgi:membrane protease YdiL (CAAX protease family)